MESFKKMVTRKVSNMNLKLQLNQLKSRNIGTFVEADLKYLIQNMLDNIGSVDPELRDRYQKCNPITGLPHIQRKSFSTKWCEICS